MSEREQGRKGLFDRIRDNLATAADKGMSTATSAASAASAAYSSAKTKRSQAEQRSAMAGTEVDKVITDVKEIDSPVPQGRNFETVAFIDASPSMGERVPGSSATKWDVLREAFPLIVRYMSSIDSSKHSEEQEEQGLNTYAFNTKTYELGHLNPDNWEDQFAKIRREGGTYIMDSWQLSQQDYARDFGDLSAADLPFYLGIVLTDGKLHDAADFSQALKAAGDQTRLGVVIIGDDAESRKAIESWQQIAREKVNPRTGKSNVTIVHLGPTDSGQLVADAVSALVSA